MVFIKVSSYGISTHTNIYVKSHKIKPICKMKTINKFFYILQQNYRIYIKKS